jgi:hypothetical protein
VRRLGLLLVPHPRARVGLHGRLRRARARAHNELRAERVRPRRARGAGVAAPLDLRVVLSTRLDTPLIRDAASLNSVASRVKP